MCSKPRATILRDILNEQYKLCDLKMAVKHSNFRDIGVHAIHNTINLII